MRPSIAHRAIHLTIIIAAIAATNTYSQIATGGEVVDLVDAKTVVVIMPAGRVKVELQYIDVPDVSQPLHQVVRDHLRNMVVGKIVEISAKGFSPEKTVARVMLNGIDVSQQLLRDGAAWHMPIELSGQSTSEFDSYAESEMLARNEKRGVWSIEGLKTPWQVRAESEALARIKETARRGNKPTPVGVSEFQSDTRGSAGSPKSVAVSSRMQMNAWVSVFANSRKEGYGLQTYNSPDGLATVVHTSPILMDFASPRGQEKLECRVLYLTVRTYNGRYANFYAIGFRAISDDYRFSKGRTTMAMVVDGKRFSFRAPYGLRGQDVTGAQEIMFFETSASVLKRIASAKSVETRINNLTGFISVDGRELIKQLVYGTE